MKWWVLGFVLLLFFPFYVFLLSKSAMMGKISAIQYLEALSSKHESKHESKEETNGKEKK